MRYTRFPLQVRWRLHGLSANHSTVPRRAVLLLSRILTWRAWVLLLTWVLSYAWMLLLTWVLSKHARWSALVVMQW